MLLKHVIPSIIWKNPRYGTTGIVCFEKTTCTRSKYFISYICIKSEGPAYFVRTQKDLIINKKYSTSHHIPNWILKTRTYVCIVTNFFLQRRIQEFHSTHVMVCRRYHTKANPAIPLLLWALLNLISFIIWQSSFKYPWRFWISRQAHTTITIKSQGVDHSVLDFEVCLAECVLI